MEDWKRLIRIILGVEKNQRILIIDPKFQWKFILLNAISSAVLTLVFFISTFYFLHVIEYQAENLEVPYNITFKTFIQAQKLKMLWVSLGVGFLIFLYQFVTSLFFSHRVAGPIFSLKRYLAQYKQQNPKKPLQFRSTDYFTDVADAVNRFVQDNVQDKPN